MAGNSKSAEIAWVPLLSARWRRITAVGKVDKKVLRARYWEGRERMVG